MAQSVYTRFGQSTITSAPQAAKRHIVVGGETLPMIAANEYVNSGYDSELWRKIAEYNSISDLDSVTVNTSLKIPPKNTITNSN
jgi:nucleoid-associated protein YgaU